MSLFDSSPERRNLIVISLITISYYLTGASFEGEVIKLPMTNLVIEDTQAAVYIFWTVFAWLNLRYWLVFRNAPFDANSKIEFENTSNYKRAFQAALCWNHVWVFWLNLVRDSNSNSLALKSIIAGGNSQKNYYLFYEGGGQLNVRIRSDNRDYTGNNYPVHTWWLRLFIQVHQFMKNAVTHPYITSWYIPWALSISALMLLFTQ